MPAAPPSAPSSSAPVAEALWAVDYPDGQDRELTLAEIEKELFAGTIGFNTLVWREGMDEWLELGQVPELQGIEPPTRIVLAPPAGLVPTAAFAPIAAGAPAAAPAPPAAPARAKMPSAPAFDLPKDLPKPRPPAPTMSGIGRPPTPLPFEVPEPAAPAFDAAPTFGAPSTFGAPPTFGTAPTFGAPPTFGAAPSFPAPAAPAAPVMVPAPAIAAPFAASVAASPRGNAPVAGAISPAAGVPDWPQERKSRAPLVLGIIIVLIAIGGGLYALKSASDDKLPPPVPISALPAATPPATHAPEPPSAEPAAAAAAPSSTGQAATSSRSALDPPSGSLTATPNAGFAELFANGARSADDKKGGAGQRFDPNAAKAALAAAAVETAKCREPGGPTGMANVMVTFDPSGKVASATVSDPPFAGTSSGACIAAALKRATVPAFTGLPGTATQIISIQ